MNYLSICQRLRSECGVSGSNATVVGATGEWGRLCAWVAQSYQEIQERHPDWQWMRKDVSFNTIANQQTYLPASAPISLTDFAAWKMDSFRLYLTSAGVNNETFLIPEEYTAFRDSYVLGARRNTYARPISITQAPSKALMFGLTPNDIYTVNGEYYKTPMVLSVDADIPDMPDRFHMLIVYRAMIHYGMFEAAGEVIARGREMEKSMMYSLEQDQLPMLLHAGAMI